MSHTLSIKLKQHSPLLHFEYKKDQAKTQFGEATLRATEVKSRLDKFILALYAKPPKHWLVGKGKSVNLTALDYKLQIKGEGVAEEKRIVPSKRRDDTDTNTLIGAYFGDAKGVYWPEGIFLAFSSFETDLLDAIYQHIVPFFVLHNFGQRQSKGFGSFTVSRVNGNPVPSYSAGQRFSTKDVEKILRQEYGTVYCLDQDHYREQYEELVAHPRRKNDNKDDISTYEIIHNEYQLLKAGRSSKAVGGYEKSKLFKFFVEGPDRIRWEKRRIKQEINKITGSASHTSPFHHRLRMETGREPIDFNPNTSQNRIYNADPTDKRYYNDYQESHAEADSYRYIRALLGLAENNEYLTESTNREDKYIVRIDHMPDSRNMSKIERFTSPILFKIYGNEVYLIPQQINPIIFGKTFQFWVDHKNQSVSMRDKPEPFEIRTPSAEEFSLLTFLDYALDKNIWKKIA